MAVVEASSEQVSALTSPSDEIKMTRSRILEVNMVN